MKTLKVTLFLSLVLFAPYIFAQSAVQVESRGKGRPVLFLPGFATPGSVWNSTIDALKFKGRYHVVSYAGFDGFEAIGTPWYDVIRKELSEFIEKNKLSNLTIVGHSMGGNLALDLAAELPDHVTGLVLVDAIPCMRELMMPGVPAESLQYKSPYNDRLINMSSEDFRNYVGNMAKNMTNDSEKVEQITQWAMEADRETYVYGYTDLLKLDLRDKLNQIKVSTLILGASFPEPAMVKSNFESQYANLQQKTIALAADSKHFIMFDQPEWLYAQIDQYLSKYGERQ
jgi:pimeloyl-ACP methyl ester carboxylesterase